MFNPEHSVHIQMSDGVEIFCTTNFQEPQLSQKDCLIVFNYGLVCSNQHWEYQISFFDKLGFKILLHDYRFHHNSSGSPDLEECNFDKMADDMKELADYFGASKIFMLGHSMGVNVTLEFARKFPEKMLGMTLIAGTLVPPQNVAFNSSLVGQGLPYILKFKDSFPKVFDTIWSNQYKNPLLKELVRWVGMNPRRVGTDFVHTYMQRMSELPPEVFFQLIEEMKNHDIAQHLGEIHTPALVVGGDRDFVIPHYLQERLFEQLNNAELYIVKDGSHVPQVDFPDTLNQRIHSFLQKQL